MKKEKGFSLIELLIVVAIIGIIAAIAIPNLLKSRQAANESSAIGSCRTIGTAQATYQLTRGRGRDFAGTAGGGDAFTSGLVAEGLVDATLACRSQERIQLRMQRVLLGGWPSVILQHARLPAIRRYVRNG